MVRIQHAQYEGGYRVRLRFDTGEEGVTDLGDVITKYKAASQLLNQAEFAKFTLDEWPTLVWPCGFDLAPEMLYERITGKRPSWQRSEFVYEAPENYKKAQ